ncbi:efflux RND transporter permease subunit [Kangiella sediminilitoris]|uniref:RND transporter n=1 Tax=Kangiella sediminilitoris TaxID=1144748 RepID=A0A1B3BE28_9GAMM|nr:MMPL family transporter [Kangiella sediminilitoris]AOE50957.1 RND transporter [Kangiella sediminilitoris]
MSEKQSNNSHINNNNATVKFGRFITNNRWLVIIASLLLLAVAVYGARFLEIKPDYRVFFKEDNPQLVAFDHIQDTYNKADNAMMVLTPKEGKVFDKETLKTIQWLTEEAWQTPYSTRVDSVTNYQHTWVTPEDEDYMLVGALLCVPSKSADFDSTCEHEAVTPDMIDNMSKKQLERLEQIVLNEPQVVNRMINPEGTVSAVNITVQLPDDKDLEGLEGKERDEKKAEILSAGQTVANYVRNLQAEVEKRNPNIEVRLTGVVMMNTAFAETGLNDMKTLTPIMLLLVIPLALFFMIRSISGTIGSVLIIIFSIMGAMGVEGWLGIFLTAPVFSVPTVVATMAVADSVHLLVTYMQNLRQGLNKNDAMVESLRINMMPIFLTSVTTVIGFLTMNFSDVPPLQDLGNVVAIGVTFAFIFSVTFLPAFILLLPTKIPKGRSAKHEKMDQFADFVVAKRKMLLPVMTVLCIGIIAFLPKNELNDEFVKYFDKTIDFRVDSDYTAENLTGLYTMFYSIQTEKDSGIHEPEFMSTLQDFVRFAEEQPEVIHVQSYTDVMKRLNKSMNGDNEGCYALPKQSLREECNEVLKDPEAEGELDTRIRELTAQFTLMYEMSLPKGMDLNNQVSSDKSGTRVQLALKNLSSVELLALEDKFAEWFDNNAPNYTIQGSSPAVMFAHVGQNNIYSMLTGTAWALVLISLLLIFALRSLKLGLLSLIPNIIPMAVAFGIWAIFQGQVGMGLSVVTGMTLGIVVDDTVHFLSKYLRARREKGLDSHAAVKYAFQTVGMALTVTTIVLVLGFLVLGMSHYVMNSHMGILTAITLAVALIIDFLLLPPLLMLIEPKKKQVEQN